LASIAVVRDPYKYFVPPGLHNQSPDTAEPAQSKIKPATDPAGPMAGLKIRLRVKLTRDSPSPDRPSRGPRTVIIAIGILLTTHDVSLLSRQQPD